MHFCDSDFDAVLAAAGLAFFQFFLIQTGGLDGYARGLIIGAGVAHT